MSVMRLPVFCWELNSQEKIWKLYSSLRTSKKTRYSTWIPPFSAPQLQHLHVSLMIHTRRFSKNSKISVRHHQKRETFRRV
jgi:hypothetical protein